ncbi:MAG TPA: hypothetical protein VE090_05840, partial [Methylomirabilota bacterium]|nr:hypothetical protein [Methylomirabilota bacterium]
NNPSYAFNGTGGLTVNGGGVNNITFGSNAGNGTVVVQPNAGGQAGLIINKQGFNDIFTASAAGITRFTLSNNGSIGLNTPLPLATLDVRANPINGGTIPVASFSGKTSFAALVVNNSGVGDILAASSGGQSRFRVTNNGSVLFQGDTISSSTSASLSNNGSGAVINALGDQGSMVPNAGFEANTTNSPFADGWVVSATNSAAVTRDTAVSAKGASSAKVTLTNGATAFYSACIPLAGTGGNYTLNWYAKATAPIPTVRAYIDGYTTKANCQSNTTPTISPAQGATITAAWVKYGSNTVAVTGWGASSTWGRVHFFIACTVNCTNAVVNIDGVRVIESTTGDGLDYAENYPADPTNIPEAGDVVALIASGSAGQVEPAHRYMDQTTLGVVSTNPGQVLDDGSISDPKVAVALSGRVPVKVSTQNGAIHLGDNLTSSAIPGVAVKAISTGPVIGVALEDFSCDSTSVCEGKVIMFIKNTYYAFAPVNTGLMLSSGGQDASVLMSLFQQPNFSIATSAAALQNTRNGLTVSGQATVSADLRVKGNGLFEGIVTIVDTLTTNNFIVNHVADFFGNVVFHGDVSIQGRPTFTRDTGGFAVIKKGSDRVQVTFSKEYEQIPVVNASISFEARDEDAKKQEEIEKSILSSNTNFIITDRSTKGFAILLAKPSEQDMTFSWVAIAVDKPIVFQSSLPLPTPTISPTPSPE